MAGEMTARGTRSPRRVFGVTLCGNFSLANLLRERARDCPMTIIIIILQKDQGPSPVWNRGSGSKCRAAHPFALPDGWRVGARLTFAVLMSAFSRLVPQIPRFDTLLWSSLKGATCRSQQAGRPTCVDVQQGVPHVPVPQDRQECGYCRQPIVHTRAHCRTCGAVYCNVRCRHHAGCPCRTFPGSVLAWARVRDMHTNRLR